MRLRLRELQLPPLMGKTTRQCRRRTDADGDRLFHPGLIAHDQERAKPPEEATAVGRRYPDGPQSFLHHRGMVHSEHLDQLSMPFDSHRDASLTFALASIPDSDGVSGWATAR